MSTQRLLGILVYAVMWLPTGSAAADDLADGFARPPDSAKAWCYWWWLDSFATREGITRDLQEMKRQGIAGALIFDAGEGKGSPVGPKFMSEAWRDLFRHAVHEAHRLGIELSANICSGWNAGGTWVTPDYAAKRLVWSAIQLEGGGTIAKELPRPESRDGYYHDIAAVAYPGVGRPADIPPLKHWEFKAARVYLTQVPETLHEELPETPRDPDCKAAQVVDLSDKMGVDGRLAWEAPAGTWTVLRFGYTLLGAQTSCSSPGSKGLEIDFLSADALDKHWAETGAKMLADAGSLAGMTGTLKYVHDDSYEVTNPFPQQLNWTPAFRDEFRARRGYDLLPYLPALAGKIVDSRGVSNRFLWDYRRTIADLFADGHYRRLRELAQKHAVGTHPESGGPFWPCIDGLLNEGINDVPMGEFWKRVPEKPDGKITWGDAHNYAICDTVRQAASAAHVYGKRVCQAEAWTSMGPNWEEDFYDLKDIGDRAFCAGLTRNMLCFWVHQGRPNDRPGYQWEAAGTHFDCNVTWWDQSRAWLTYLARCQFMLQQGLFVADLCYFYGEDAPNYVPNKGHMRPALPRGYDCDTINADALLTRMSVRDGRLTLPDGMSYRLLVLPDRRAMSLHLVRKVKELIEAGATVVGPKPKRAPGLGGFPSCDAEVRRIADEVWGDMDGTTVKQRSFGRGRVIWGKGLAEILAGDGLPPDVEVRATAGGPAAVPGIDWIHRRTGEADIYFLSNQSDQQQVAEVLFRVAGRQPHLGDAVTGAMWPASQFAEANGRTVLPLRFAPRQSWFVMFRGLPAAEGSSRPNVPTLVVAKELGGPWSVRFDPKWGGPASVVFEQLEDWTKRPEPGIRYYSGRAVYEKTFDLPESLRGAERRTYLDLGRVRNVAEVRLNGKDLGVVWTAPWHVDITNCVKPAGNSLEIVIVNLWPNRLIGDAALPPEKRLTVTNVKKFKADSPLLESGLLGPVTLQTAE